MPRTIAIPIAGEMGAGLGSVLSAHGARVFTMPEGRSAATRARAEEAGMVAAGLEEIAAAGVILSVVPPAVAVETAERVVAAIPEGHKPVFVDLNAVSPARTRQIAEIVEAAGVRFVEGGIIGGPPRPGREGPRLYLSGPAAADALFLGELGLDVRAIEGGVGAASALKMCYGAMTKGLTGITAAMLGAAERAGIGADLHAELSYSQPAQLQRAGHALPDMYRKAYRWVDEMRQIAEFLGDRPEAHIWRGLADLYQRLADDHAGEGSEIAALDRFLARRD